MLSFAKIQCRQIDVDIDDSKNATKPLYAEGILIRRRSGGYTNGLMLLCFPNT
jgi:hypothetical protein